MNQKSSLGFAGALLVMIPQAIQVIFYILELCKVSIVKGFGGNGLMSMDVYRIVTVLLAVITLIGFILLVCWFAKQKGNASATPQAYPSQAQQAYYQQQQAMQRAYQQQQSQQAYQQQAYQQQQQAYQQQQQAYQQAQQAQQQAQQAYPQQAANQQQGQGYYGYNQANYNQPK